MFDFLNGIFESTTLTIGNFLLCIVTSLLLGAFLSFIYAIRTKTTKSFLLTLGILPAVVCVVIMMVNGNVGAGVAVAGAFSLVRFRSAPGTAKEIAVIFLAMASGIIAGMGYLGYSVFFTLIMGLVLLGVSYIKFPSKKSQEKTLQITIPEDLDYTGLFDDIFETYTSEHKVIRVKTTNLGSMFKITYFVCEKDVTKEKEMIDMIRTRNGNLEVSISEWEENKNEL